ncbi:MAG: type II secretion system protein [Fimbriimonadia bacterium]|jgi:prepilin-type N-terminal cleavage/methylation domain-containing protein
MRRPHGFTLIELLVVIAIIALLASILFPVFSRARSQAHRSACLNNLMQMGKALILYADSYDGKLVWVPDEWLQLTPPTPTTSLPDKAYCRLGWAMWLLHPYAKSNHIYACPAVPVVKEPGDWRVWFSAPWLERGVERPDKGWANYISDKLAEKNPERARYARARRPEQVAHRLGTSVSKEEFILDAFYEDSFPRDEWSSGESVPPVGGWAAHYGGRNQLHLDLHAAWQRRNVRQ